MSPFHFQRMFSMLCVFTPGDYIRMRHLALAAKNLICTNEKVINVVYNYDYNTPESFFLALTQFHAITRRKRAETETLNPFLGFFQLN